MSEVPPHVIENEVAAALWMHYGRMTKKLLLRRDWSELKETERKRWRIRARAFTKMLRAQGVSIQ